MKTLIRWFAVMLLVTCAGCASWGKSSVETANDVYRYASTTSNTVALIVETSQALTANLEKQELADLLARARADSWPASKLVEEGDKIKARWKPVKALYTKIRAIHEALRQAITTYGAALEAGQEPNIANLLRLVSELSALCDDMRSAVEIARQGG